jgi:SpoIID/LytB domain protein
MSQYGACGRALTGQSCHQILASYYRGVELQRQPRDPTVAVLLGERDLGGSHDVIVPPVGVTVLRALGGGGAARLSPGTYRVHYLSNGELYRLVNVSSDVPAGIYPRPVQFEPESGITLGYGGRRYRGVLRVLRSRSKLLLTNHLPVELYVRGVLPNEMLPFWPLEALKSQAIVTRSYALSVHRSNHFDCYADTRDQIYGGASSETRVTNEAVSATAQTCAVFDGEPIEALFHSSSAGCTEDASYVFSARPYLKSLADVDAMGHPFEASAHRGCPWIEWSGSVDAKGSPQLGIGAITAVNVLGRSPSGRATKVELSGTQGRATISGEYDIRSGLKSTGLRLADGSLHPPGPLPSASVSFFNP